MPTLKIDDREYGLGDDVVLLPDDPNGYGPRAMTLDETARLILVLEGLGYEAMRSPRVHRVYVIENGGRRVVTLDGVPLDVYYYGRPAEPAPAENPIDGPNPADEAPVELVPLEDAPTDPVVVPALVEPEIPAAAPIEPGAPGFVGSPPVEELAPKKPEEA
jgi:hypothetical protein